MVVNMRAFSFSIVLCLLSFAYFPASAQTHSNPDASDCGMPLSGTIRVTEPYTLTKDCVLTGTIEVSGANNNTDVTLTINGGNHTISSSSASPLFQPQSGTNWSTTINLNNLTIDLKNVARTTAITVNGALNLSNVT